MSWSMLFILVNSLSALVVIWSSLCATNRMSGDTPWPIRLSFILVGVGAAAALLAPGYLGRAPSDGELLLIAGLALLALVDRREARQ